MSAPGQPFQTNGFQTSMDIARRQPYNNVVTSLAGRKRSSGVSLEDSLKIPNSSKDHAQHRNLEKNIGYPGSTDFVRASSPIHKNRLIASEIRPVTGKSTGHGLHVNQQGSQSTESTDSYSGRGYPLSLKDPVYGLPPALVANFAALGVDIIYPWQASCLLGKGLLEGNRHLVYTAPTGGGKSLVADVLMLKRVIENPSRKAILVLPYVALVWEKLKFLRRVVQDVEKMVPVDNNAEHELDSRPAHQKWRKMQKSIQVTGFFGGSKSTTTWADTDIAVCTIEKVGLGRIPIKSKEFIQAVHCSDQFLLRRTH